MKEYKNPITIRQNHLTCPLPLALESYWNCEADCLHCMGRRLNQIWGEEQRATNPDHVYNTLTKTKTSSTNPVSQALVKKKAFFLGRKADPYQPIETKLRVTQGLIKILSELNWEFIICSRYQSNMIPDIDLLVKNKHIAYVLTELTPGGDQDWELLERKRTTIPSERLRITQKLQKQGVRVGVRGEPFIPGYHTFAQFRDTLKLLKDYNIKSYNIYNLHINEYTIKRLYAVGLDIEKIWTLNQDVHWRAHQRKLCDIALEEGITLGCPDFVNVRRDWHCPVNTCCGIEVKGAFTFNTHNWRNLVLSGKKKETILEGTWEGIGNKKDEEMAHSILHSKDDQDFYTFKDAEL
mgnify:CR=1 FL=1